MFLSLGFMFFFGQGFLEMFFSLGFLFLGLGFS